MPDYSKPLGDGVKRTRKRLDLTQNEVADSIDLSPCNYHLDTTLAFEWLFKGESGEFSLECYDGGNIF